MNKWIGIGRLVRDPETRFAAGSGTAITNITLAIDREFKKDGNKETDFINCVAFGKRAETISNNLSKGRLVAVEGKIQTSSYQDKDGKKVYKTEIVIDQIQFLDWPKDGSQGGSNSPEDSGFFPTDDDVPF